jgi:hypothetical protein
MTDRMDFVAISDAEGATIVGGVDWLSLIVSYLVNNAGEVVAGIKDGYAAGSPK